MSLPVGLFNGCKSLLEIHLQSNQLSSLPDGLFDGCKSLYKVNLGSNHLTSLPDRLLNECKKLKTIHLEYNQLTSLPDGLFVSCKSFSNQLTSLPVRIFNGCKSLSKVDLGKNKLKSIPVGIFNDCKVLLHVDLQSNQLTSLPDGLFDGCESLYDVNFGSNHLTSLPHGLFNDFKYADTKDLIKNDLDVLPARPIKGFCQLTYISFYENKLSTIPPHLFSGCNAIRKVSFECNQIASIPPDLFKDCSSVISGIVLRRNRITSIPAVLLSHCERLRAIDLAYNKISSIPADLFADCCELRSIDLSHNRIRELSDSAFNGCGTVTSLLLENNNIKSVSFRSLEPLIKCVDINITNNLFYNSNSIFTNVFRKEKNCDSCEIVRGEDEKAIERFFISFFLSLSSKNFDSIQSLKKKFERWTLKEFTFLDLLISVFGEIDDSKVTNLKIHVNELMTKNPLLENMEFKIRSEKSIVKLCKRNVFSHFQAFFPNTFHQLISLVQKTKINASNFKLEEEKVFRDFRKYVAITSHEVCCDVSEQASRVIFHHINYTECFNIALNNKNCEIAKFVIILLRYYFLVWDFKLETLIVKNSPSYREEREQCFKKAQTAVNEFNRNLVAKYDYIFRNDLTEIIVFLLDIKKLDSLKHNYRDKSMLFKKPNIEEITNFLDFDLDPLIPKETEIVDSKVVDDLKNSKPRYKNHNY